MWENNYSMNQLYIVYKQDGTKIRPTPMLDSNYRSSYSPRYKIAGVFKNEKEAKIYAYEVHGYITTLATDLFGEKIN